MLVPRVTRNLGPLEGIGPAHVFSRTLQCEMVPCLFGQQVHGRLKLPAKVLRREPALEDVRQRDKYFFDGHLQRFVMCV